MLLAQTIGHMVYQPGETDAHGNPEDAWADPVDVWVYGYAPRGESTEPAGTQVIVGLEVYAPAMAVDARDRFVVGGKTYEVDGEIGDWTKGPFGFTPGMTIALKRVEGGQ